ncbi:MAG: hypothetical protein M0009_12635 [Deltaproteobacteria bacterium]|nr:hypothetical protein [Deltaproteobacteria bacterium]
MIIANANLSMTAESRLEKTDSRRETLKMWVDPPQTVSAADTSSISPQAKEAAATRSPEEVTNDDPKLLLIKKLIEAMTGKSIRLLEPGDLSDPSRDAPDLPGQGQDAAAGGTQRVGWGVRYDYAESHSETERTAFRAAGVVRTADGKELSFALDVQMARSFTSSTSVSFRAGDALIDPLVINFNGPAALLTDQKFSFDLDVDGRDETIPFVGEGSGLLAFDRNGDGAINDGSELFGPTTGNGFAELATFDGDQSGWIDEKDAAYQGLRIWTKAADGTDVLAGLKESGVGAIFTGYADTAFSLKDDANRLVGQLRRTGVYLTDGGAARSLQQVDIAV